MHLARFQAWSQFARVDKIVFDRIARLFRSNVNDLISQAEQPEKMLNQLIGDMNGQLIKAKQQVAAANVLEPPVEIARQQRQCGEQQQRIGVVLDRSDENVDAFLAGHCIEGAASNNGETMSSSQRNRNG